MVLICKHFLTEKECQFWKDYCLFATANDTKEVGLVKKDKPLHRVDRKYYTIRDRFEFMERVKDVTQEKWKQKLFYTRHYYGHIMHYCKQGQGLEWHNEPTIATVSMSINLSTEDEYKGAEFQIKRHKFELNQGDAVFYDSKLLHRVTPLLEGHKKSLVMWLCNREQAERAARKG